MTAMVTMNTRTRASAPRFRASSPRTLTLAFARACCKCMRVRDPGPHARTRLAELGDSNVDHTWLWRLNPRHGSTLDADEYVDSVRFRLGCAGPRNPSPAPPATPAFWTRARRTPPAALWARPRVVTTPSPLSYTQPHNSATTPQVPGLIPGTDLRPADVLTSALDVSICSPHALEAGTDCTQSRVEAKLECPPPGCPSSPEHLLHPDCVECLWATSPRHVDRFALSQQIHRAQTQHRLG